MCLIVFAWQTHPDFPLVLAANRDEFHARPSAPLGRWPTLPQVLGGRDLQAGGSWLGVADDGRFAALTNYRDGRQPPPRQPQSRGLLLRDYFNNVQQPVEYIEKIEPSVYAGFNLLLGDAGQLVYVTNAPSGLRVQPLLPGIYGVSNATLDTLWPKLVRAKTALTRALPGLHATDPASGFAACFDFLADRALTPDADLPDTGVPLDWERQLSAIFISGPEYGTRASTVLTRNRAGECRIHEKRFGPDGVFLGERQASSAPPLASRVKKYSDDKERDG
ncbi:MAG: NRDE family protein [Zoogloeaceae bacterium]|nr:NRDE family protein [Zoogloeaceae bacterium]